MAQRRYATRRRRGGYARKAVSGVGRKFMSKAVNSATGWGISQLAPLALSLLPILAPMLGGTAGYMAQGAAMLATGANKTAQYLQDKSGQLTDPASPIYRPEEPRYRPLVYDMQTKTYSVKGNGAYTINNNSLLSGMDPPSFIDGKNEHGVMVRHREYLGDITPTSAFTIQTFNINPGLDSTFPWLSGVANNFEQYRFHGLLFEFKSMCSDSVVSTNANGALGTVIMATQYNALDVPFPDKRTMENYEFANSAKPSESQLHPVECKPSLSTLSTLYTRSGAIAAGSDQRFYDLGEFNIATQGMQSTTGVCGELWVTFEVELIKPKFVTGIGYELLTDHYNLVTPQSATPLGTTATALVPGSNLGTTISIANRTIYFPANMSDGLFMINYFISGTSAALVSPVFSSTHSSFETYWGGDTIANPTNTATTSGYFFANIVLQVTAQNATFVLGAAGTLPTAPNVGDLWITQINGAISS